MCADTCVDERYVRVGVCVSREIHVCVSTCVRRGRGGTYVRVCVDREEKLVCVSSCVGRGEKVHVCVRTCVIRDEGGGVSACVGRERRGTCVCV